MSTNNSGQSAAAETWDLKGQNSVGVRALPGPMHLGLNDKPFVPHILC